MIARGIKFEAYKDSWTGEAFLDEDVIQGFWLLDEYKEHAHADASGYMHDVEAAVRGAAEAVKAEAVYRVLDMGLDGDAADYAVEDAMDAWYSRGEDEDVAEAVSMDALESLRGRMAEWLEDEEKYGRDYEPEDPEIVEKREWLEAVSERLARRKR